VCVSVSVSMCVCVGGGPSSIVELLSVEVLRFLAEVNAEMSTRSHNAQDRNGGTFYLLSVGNIQNLYDPLLWIPRTLQGEPG
jgi:hypothetical protein